MKNALFAAASGGRFFVVLMFWYSPVFGQAVLTTIAGTDRSFQEQGKVLGQAISDPTGLAFDSSGNLFAALRSQHRVIRIAQNGTAVTVAGTGQRGYSGDGGPATQATLNEPLGIALGPDGSLYIADHNNYALRKVDGNGIITSVCGNGFLDPLEVKDRLPLPAAWLNWCGASVAADRDGNIFVGSEFGYVTRITPDGLADLYSGGNPSGQAGLEPPDGMGKSANLGAIFGMAVDVNGNLFISEFLGFTGQIRRVTPDGRITTVGGGGQLAAEQADGVPARMAMLSFPAGISFDAAGNLYVAEFFGDRIRQISPDGRIKTVAGGGAPSANLGDGGKASSASLASPYLAVFSQVGEMFIADCDHFRIRKVDLQGTITTVAGGPSNYQGDGGPAAAAKLDKPYRLAVDAGGNVYVCDTYNQVVRRIDANGIITTVAGNGQRGFSGDNGKATQASLANPQGIALDKTGNLYISDTLNGRIRKVDAQGMITTFAGNGCCGPLGDEGNARNAALTPRGIAIDRDGNLLVADFTHDRVRKITPAGLISTIAGDGVPRFAGDQGPATLASLLSPRDVFVNAAGEIFIADFGNSRIRKVNVDGEISTVVGGGLANQDGKPYEATFGPAAAAHIASPEGITGDTDGNLYLVSPDPEGLRRVDPSGKITFLSHYWFGFNGDYGPASLMQLAAPQGVTVGPNGDLFVADTYNDRVRKITGAGAALSIGMNPWPVFEMVGSGTHRFEVFEVNGNDLNWSAEADYQGGPQWFSVEATTNAIEIRYSSAGLSPGAHVGRVLIKADGAANSPLALTITEVVEP